MWKKTSCVTSSARVESPTTDMTTRRTPGAWSRYSDPKQASSLSGVGRLGVTTFDRNARARYRRWGYPYLSVKGPLARQAPANVVGHLANALLESAEPVGLLAPLLLPRPDEDERAARGPRDHAGRRQPRPAPGV